MSYRDETIATKINDQTREKLKLPFSGRCEGCGSPGLLYAATLAEKAHKAYCFPCSIILGVSHG